MSNYQTYTYDNIKFVFKFDSVDPTLLHIYARHMMEADDAIELFFDTTAVTTWNGKLRRFETYTANRGLFWYWMTKDKVVMVVSCFRI